MQRSRSFLKSWWLLPALVTPALLSAGDVPDAVSHGSGDSNQVPAWRLKVLDLGWDTRFNYMDQQGGTVTDRGLQYRLRTRARLDLLKGGGTYLVVRAETGRGFDNSWNNAGVGLAPGQMVFNLKAISLHQKLTNSLEAEAGGIDYDRGAGMDTVYASGDGHMTGYRTVFHSHSAGLPEKVSITAAYVGDFDKPNFFSRIRMDRVNYVQALAEQHFTDRRYGSVEVDAIHDAIFLRGALRSGRFWEFDDVTVDAATRTTDRFRFAWSMSASRRWTSDSRWRTDLIYSDLPFSFYVVNGRRVLLNRGEIDVGKRLAVGTVHRLAPSFEAEVFAARLLDSTPSKRWVAQVGLSYQFAGLVNRLLR